MKTIGMDHIWLQKFLLQGPNILTILVQYACKDDNADLICNLDKKGLNMLAINNPKRIIYAFNLFQLVPNMLATIEILFLRDSSKNYSYVILGRFQILQAYLVPFKKDCKHI